jgi:hypothetical protein
VQHFTTFSRRRHHHHHHLCIHLYQSLYPIATFPVSTIFKASSVPFTTVIAARCFNSIQFQYNLYRFWFTLPRTNVDLLQVQESILSDPSFLLRLPPNRQQFSPIIFRWFRPTRSAFLHMGCTQIRYFYP